MDYLKFKELSHSDDLQHYGIKGQRWGIRRFQNEDGSLTPAGLKKQAKDADKQELKGIKKELHKKNRSALRTMLTPNGKSMSYNSALQRRTVKRAAKYVQKNNMSLDDALYKSKAVGRRNRAIAYMSVVGAFTVSSIISAKTSGLMG